MLANINASPFYYFTLKKLNFILRSVCCKVVSGGVASNQYVRAQLDMVVKKNDLQLVCPPPRLCTDNGNNIFLVAYNNEG